MSDPQETPQFLRRDFLVGSLAGFAATRSADWFGREPARFPDGSNPSYAQCGEDVIILALFDFLKVKKPTFLDIGAYLPIYSNNTYLFYTKGSRGVLVEPNVGLIPELVARRPGDSILNVGIGLEKRTEAPYYCMSLPQWNTFDREEAERRVARTEGKATIEKVVSMPLIPINEVIAEHFHGAGPDLLSIDVEGLDLAILRTMDFERYRPRVICAETLIALDFKMDPALDEFLGSKGYEPRARTFPNTIYVDRNLLG